MGGVATGLASSDRRRARLASRTVFDTSRDLLLTVDSDGRVTAANPEATAVLAAARPDHNVLALEVWLPGIADSLRRCE